MTVIALVIGLRGIGNKLVRFEGGHCGCQKLYSSDLFKVIRTIMHLHIEYMCQMFGWHVRRFGGIDQLNDLSTKRNTLWNALCVYLPC